MKKYIKPENWIHGMSLEKKGLLKSQQKKFEVTYNNGDKMISEWESEMVQYMKHESKRPLGLHKLLIFWVYVPVMLFLMSMSMMVVAFIISAMFIKDWFVRLFHSLVK
tara:strand:+ start:342 stop:665 length:324 start_codon:yes stop_codon:yes gene_type:complete